MAKPLLSLDFDGVIHLYSTGWTAIDNVADAPTPGAFQFIREALDYFEVAIFSVRTGHPGGLEAIQKWFADNGLEPEYRERLQFPVAKPPAYLVIDDRALLFTGNFPDPSRLLGFRTWVKGTPEEAQEFYRVMEEKNA